MKHYKYIFLGVLLLIVALNCSTVNQLVEIDTHVVPTKKEKEEPVLQELLDKISVKENIARFKTNEQEQKWVDSIYAQMTLEEKFGQLFMISAYSNKDEKHFAEVEKLVTDYKVGGVIFFQGGPVRQAKLTNRFQNKSKIPLFIGIDAEWGLSMRLDSTYRYPYNMTLGAIKDVNLIKKVGEQMGKQSKRLGIHFTFAPVLDINTNPLNPIIGNRSFGEDKNNVTNKAVALMVGLQSQGIIATGKHFPGHGDTATDSHHTLPIVPHTKERLQNIELYPYKKMFDAGLQSVMVAHLNVPSYESKEGTPSSISSKIVTDLLQKDLGFKGLIFTDALNMKGASNFKKPGEIDLAAFLAGNDVLLFPENVPAAIEIFKKAFDEKKITDERLAISVKKILAYKYKAGLKVKPTVNTNNLYKDLNPPSNDSLQYALYENAITLLKNDKEVLPIKDLRQKVAYIKLGDDDNSTFVKALSSYTDVQEIKAENAEEYNKKLKNFDIVIIGFHKSDKPWKNQEFTASDILLVQEIAKSNKVILDVFAKPYTLLPFKSIKNIETILMSYQNNPIAQEVSAEIIFGSVIAKGSLPVSINKFFFANKSLTTVDLKRLGFSNPEFVGVDSEKLKRIDEIANKAIQLKTTPGLQVLVARKGKIIYQKAFGTQTYDKQTPISNTDIYDIASISKMVGTLPLVMQQFDKKKIALDTKLSEMLPVFKNTNKDSIVFKDLMTHNARLQAWIPFYKATLDSCNKFQPSTKYYRKFQSDSFSIAVSKNLFLRNDYKDTIFAKIVASKLLDKKQYKYSDLTFIILKEYLEKTLKKPLEKLTQDEFFLSMGMYKTMYNPYTKFPITSIPPTENDNYFRYETIQGYVHDMEAAMEGGVAGHAGLFSNTLDVAKMMQLYLQKGYYGGIQYFSANTFDVFNTCYFCKDGNRRGLGFDKPQLGKEGPTCGCVPMSSFGHTGFTGGIAWADPENELVYIFLSNRTFPDSNATNKLSRENIREDIQKVIQNALYK